MARRRLCASAILSMCVVGHAAPELAAQPRSRSEPDVERLAPGRFLVASRGLGDPNFRQTVVLLVEYNRLEGALGLVINRPSEVDLSQVLPRVGSAPEELGPVYIGGPVEPLQFTLLLRATEAPESARHVFADVHFSSSRDLLESLARPVGEAQPFRAYAGYAGWAIGQLEAEISIGGWHVVDGQASAIFDTRPEDLWRRLILVGTADWAALRGATKERPS